MDAKTLDKIKKMLRIANDRNATSAEAAAALAAARRAALAAGVDLSNVDLDSDTAAGAAGLGHDRHPIAAYGILERLTMVIVSSICCVNFLTVKPSKKYGIKGHFTVIGTDDARQLASYYYQFITRTARRSWDEERKTALEDSGEKLDRTWFIRGYLSAIYRALKQVFSAEIETSTALAPAFKDYISTALANIEVRESKARKPKPCSSNRQARSARIGKRRGEQDGITQALPAGETAGGNLPA